MAYQQIYTCQECGKQFIKLYTTPKRFTVRYCEQCSRRRKNSRSGSRRIYSGSLLCYESEVERKKTHPSTMPDLIQTAKEASEQNLSYGELVARRYMDNVHNHRQTDK